MIIIPYFALMRAPFILMILSCAGEGDVKGFTAHPLTAVFTRRPRLVFYQNDTCAVQTLNEL